MSQPHIILLIASLLPGVTGAAIAAAPAPKAAASRKPGQPLTSAQQRISEASCKQAVQGFYDWYLPRLMREVRTPAMTQALNGRSGYFSAELRRRLAADTAAAAKSPDEIVGLDFDPFVNSQDPAARYVVKKASRTAKGFRVEVHGVIDGKVNEAPDVIPELVLSRGHWMFVNFHYPAEGTEPKTDLLEVLKVLRDNRRKPARRSGAVSSPARI